MTVAYLIFYISVGAIAWAYIGYPAFLWILQRLSKYPEHTPIPVKDGLPEIDVIFAAYNEEAVIQQKLESLFKSDYPTDKINVYVGSDASTDRTDAIVQRMKAWYPQIHLVRFEGRTGKSGIINALVEQSTSPIILATDANIFFNPTMVRRMVRHFMYHPEVELVGGNIIYRDVRKKGIAGEEKMYLQYENLIKTWESNVWNIALGVEGGCYMIRRNSFQTIPPLTFMEDFFMTMAVIKKGGAVRFDQTAMCTEDVSIDGKEEFKRKVRISLGNFQNLARFKSMMIRPFWPVGFAFLSHKILRWITPILLIFTLISSGFACWSGEWWIQVAFYTQAAFLLIAVLFALLPRWSSRSFILRFVGHFYLMNFALLKGLMIYIQGVETNVWQPTKRDQERS